MTKRLTLADVCRIAAKNGVGIRIFVQDNQVGRIPQVITIQVARPNRPEESKAFYMEITEGNPDLEEALAGTLMDYVKKVSAGPIILFPNILAKA